ncbi:GGDEF domain-containing protein [Colwellia sp. BRX10-3]|uniref:sensor domain-containing diguanylate cyclase n=1 Tax=Colwellia sp. BRX10-3 TaxID=2759844 RepID=UPI0015F77AE2|nr:sensor domain-containing diguanylate cyclase [Colwellia sp. BRX10-3]MBA6390169.1 GGDEF domain-containing protein [Colwellia sp. BRX10-3]
MASLIDNHDNALELMLLRSENKFSTMFQLSSVGMAVVDAETGNFLEVNNAVLISTAYTRDEFINLSYWDITPKEYEEQERQQIKDLEETGRFGPNQKEYIRKDGTRYPINISGVALTDTDGRKIVLGIIEDISERKAYEHKLEYFALYDPLTNIPNRRLLSEKLHQSLAQCKRDEKLLALLMLDLDKFKPVNDTYGHRIGDKLLVKVAQRITDVVHRESDTVARLGGDEFVIILPFISTKNDAVKMAENICTALVKPFYIEKNKITISSSIGIAMFPEHGNDEKTLMVNSDVAMYKAKNSNKESFKLFEN